MILQAPYAYHHRIDKRPKYANTHTDEDVLTHLHTTYYNSYITWEGGGTSQKGKRVVKVC